MATSVMRGAFADALGYLSREDSNGLQVHLKGGRNLVLATSDGVTMWWELSSSVNSLMFGMGLVTAGDDGLGLSTDLFIPYDMVTGFAVTTLDWQAAKADFARP